MDNRLLVLVQVVEGVGYIAKNQQLVGILEVTIFIGSTEVHVEQLGDDEWGCLVVKHSSNES